MSDGAYEDSNRNSVLVVLLMPELLPPSFNADELRASLQRTDRLVRVLFRVAERDQLPVALEFSHGAVPTQLLLGRDVTPPAGNALFARWPQGGNANDLDEFAFAMADVVLVDPSRAGDRRARRAKELGKSVIEPGGRLPPLPALETVTRGLDPNARGFAGWGRRVFGRLEQAKLEFLAFDWLNQQPDGRGRSWRRLRACWHGKWGPKAYFAPASCDGVAPDPAIVDRRSPMVERFEALDRSALYGSHIHRDQIWFVHALGALAVLAAVGGAAFRSSAVFAWVEIATLVIMAMLVILVRRFALHDRWTACRMAAEQLRIARMCLPMMVLPPALISVDTVVGSPGHGDRTGHLTTRALAEVKRAIRDQGLLLLGLTEMPDTAVEWLRCIVGDQIHYHRGNYERLERAEQSANVIELLIFTLVIVTVLFEMFATAHAGESHSLYPLLLTAGGPAVVAALHGAMTRLGIVHRIALSRLAERDLQPIYTELTDIAGRPVKTNQVWADVRALAFRAADAMGRENTSWHGQVRLQRDALA